MCLAMLQTFHQLAILLMNIFAPLIDYCVVQSNISRREKRTIKSNQ